MRNAAFPVLFVLACLPLSAHATEPLAVGDWSGALHRGDAAYRVRFHVQATRDGRLTGAVTGLPGDDSTPVPAAVEASGDTLVIDAAGGRYTGVWNEAKGAWVGSWKEADLSEPLALRWDGDSRTAVRAAKKPIVTLTPPALPSAVPER